MTSSHTHCTYAICAPLAQTVRQQKQRTDWNPRIQSGRSQVLLCYLGRNPRVALGWRMSVAPTWECHKHTRHIWVTLKSRWPWDTREHQQHWRKPGCWYPRVYTSRQGPDEVGLKQVNGLAVASSALTFVWLARNHHGRDIIEGRDRIWHWPVCKTAL